MATYLVKYLLITGLAGAVAVFVPGLVVVGFFLIIPGVFLALMPTAFLWGAIFAAVWWPARAVLGNWLATALALVATVAVLIAVPWLANTVRQSRIDTLRAEDRDAEGPIPLRGMVRFERTTWTTAQMDDPDWQARLATFASEKRRIDWSERPVACDALCGAALFSPGIEAVIVTPMRRPGDETRMLDRAMEFRLDRTPGCTGSLRVYSPVGRYEGLDDIRNLQDEWRIRISQGNCIRRSAVTRKGDFTVSIADLSLPIGSRGTTWSLTSPYMSVLRMEVRDAADGALLRRTRVDTKMLSPILWIEGNGDLQSFHFDWASTWDAKQGAFTPVGLLAKLTPLQFTSDPGFVADAARRQLAETLHDAERNANDPAFALTDRVLDDIGKNGLRPGDAELIESIISDPRTRSFPGLWNVIRKMGPDAVHLRAPIARRILAARYPDDSVVSSLGQVLSTLPAGAFATPIEEETQLLDDLGRRNWATGLIARQADRGSEAVPVLTRILAEGWRQPFPNRGTRNLDAAQAARRGLCLLGSDAQSALPVIEQLVKDGSMPQRQLDQRDWQLTLARLGKPIESFSGAPDGKQSDAQVQEALRRRLARFKPERDCHVISG
jgi:hypothetical protein